MEVIKMTFKKLLFLAPFILSGTTIFASKSKTQREPLGSNTQIVNKGERKVLKEKKLANNGKEKSAPAQSNSVSKTENKVHNEKKQWHKAAKTAPATLVKLARPILDGKRKPTDKQLRFQPLPGLVEQLEPPRALTIDDPTLNDVPVIEVKDELQILCTTLEKGATFDETYKRCEWYLKESEKARYENGTFISKIIAEYSSCCEMLEHIDPMDNSDFELRKGQLNILNDEILPHIVEYLNYFLFHTNRSIQLFSIEKALKDFFDVPSNGTGWVYIKQNMKLVWVFNEQYTYFVQAALKHPNNGKNIEKLKKTLETMLVSLEELLIKIEKHIQNNKEQGVYFLEKWAQIVNRLYAQFERLYKTDISINLLWLTDRAKEQLSKIKTIKERIALFINKETAELEKVWNIIQGTQEFNTAVSENEKISVLTLLHQALISFDAQKSWKNYAVPQREKIQRLSLLVSNNAAPLMIHYLEKINASRLGVDGPNCYFEGHIDDPLWHLLGHMQKNNVIATVFSEKDRESILKNYTELKINILKNLIGIQQKKIEDGISNHTITPQELNLLIQNLKRLYAYYQKLNKHFFEIGVETNLANVRPSLEKLDRIAKDLIEKLTKEKNSLKEELLFTHSHACNPDITLEDRKDAFIKILTALDSFRLKYRIIEKFTSSQAIQADRNYGLSCIRFLGAHFEPILQEHLLLIHGSVTQALLGNPMRSEAESAWAECNLLIQSLKHFIRNVHKDDIKHWITSPEKVLEAFNAIRLPLIRFILPFEQEIKNDLITQKIDVSMLKNKINKTFHSAICTLENLNNIFFDMGLADHKIELHYKVKNFNQAANSMCKKSSAGKQSNSIRKE